MVVIFEKKIKTFMIIILKFKNSNFRHFKILVINIFNFFSKMLNCFDIKFWAVQAGLVFFLQSFLYDSCFVFVLIAENQQIRHSKKRGGVQNCNNGCPGLCQNEPFLNSLLPSMLMSTKPLFSYSFCRIFVVKNKLWPIRK